MRLQTTTSRYAGTCTERRSRATRRTDAFRRASAALLFSVASAAAHGDGFQRELLLRQQQSDAFTLQLRQSQETLFSRGGPGMESRHLWERQRLDNLGAQQLQSAIQPLSADPEIARQLQPYQRQRAADERLLILPPPVVRQVPGQRPEHMARPLPVPMGY